MLCTTRMRAGCTLLGGVLLLATAGCQTTQGGDRPPTPGGGRGEKSSYEDIEKVEKRDDVVRIVQFWGQDPWIYDSIGRAIGFKVSTYYVSSETEKGVFVPGRVFVWLHVVQRAPNRELVRRTVHMWQMDQAESFLFAYRKQAIGGYFYGFMLTWPRSLDLGGQTLEIEFAYERGDGRLVLSSGRTFRVPLDPREAFTPPMIRPKGFGDAPSGDPAPMSPPGDPLPPPVESPTRQPLRTEDPTAPTPPGADRTDPAMRARMDELERRAREILAEKRREQAAGATTQPASDDTPAAGRP